MRQSAAIAAFFAILAAGSTLAQSSSAGLSYNRDVRPILSENCFACHGPDKAARKADLRLDDHDAAVAAGAIVPGNPDKSLVVERIFTTDGDDLMPPAASHKSLTPDQKETIRRWIAGGAAYEPHWAYITPSRPAVPDHGAAGAERPKNPIDAFVGRRLAAAGLEISEPADPATLLRRLSLDLTGLPPAPDDVRAFNAAPSEAAYRAAVDRLLASRHFGERMAVPWLDVVRFADTVGYHGDQNQRIFPYRDYVINAFNRNKRFDVFVAEQLAGDLMPGAGEEQLVASGFNRLNMMTREGGAQPREYLAKYAGDRVRTLGSALLGSTLSCAECHDHKYDPFTMRDFYSLAAFFADLRQWGVYSDYNYTPNPDLRGYNNDWPFPPEITVRSEYLAERIDRLWTRIDAIAAGADLPETEVREWESQIAAFLAEHPDGWARPHPDMLTTAKGTPAGFHADDASIRLEGPPRKGESLTVVLRDPGVPVSAIRLDVLPTPEADGRVARGDAERVQFKLRAELAAADGSDPTPWPFLFAVADEGEPTAFRNGAPLPLVSHGWRSAAGRADRPISVVLFPGSAAHLDGGRVLFLHVDSDAASAIRISVSPFADLGSRHEAPPPGLTAVAEPTSVCVTGEGGLGDSQPAALLRTSLVLSSRSTPADTMREINGLRQAIAECDGGRAVTMVSEAVDEPLDVRVLPRGNWQDESGPLVDPDTPGFLPRSPADSEDRRLNRLDLARWITSRDNPLTARTFVNRLWKQFFGRGISAVLDDLGNQGEWPTHPDLLDWLAVEFIESGWDVKHVVRLIVTSDTYRQTSDVAPEVVARDPLNHLLGRQVPRRLEAEFVRDNALAAADLLNRDVGGPSVHPYQPVGYYANLNFPVRDYEADTDDRQFRRGLYMHWQRTFLHPMLANFDAPSREECAADRTVSNTPQQALTLLNDPAFVEAARAFATTLIRSHASADDRLSAAFLRTLAREPKPAEAESLHRFVEHQLARFRSDESATAEFLATGILPAPGDIDAAELAAWTSACRVVLNLHETLTRY